MDVWVTLLAALGPALGKALYDVGKEVVKPLTGPLAELVRERMLQGYNAKVGDANVREAVEAAARATGLTRWEDLDAYTLRRALHHLAEEGRVELHKRTVAAALAMTRESPDQVPQELLRTLDVDERHWPDLARFLWAFRQALAQANEEYRALVELAHQDAVRDHLRTLASTIVQTYKGPAHRVTVVGRAAGEIEASYLSAVVAECSMLPLGGRDFRDSTPLGLSMPLERVYIALDTTERPPEARGAKDDFGEGGRAPEAKSVSALRSFVNHRHLVLLGEPGSGKTTFADHLALCLAGERRQPGTGWAEYLRTHDAAWEEQPPLPIRLRLRRFAADSECLPTDGESGQAEHLLAYINKRLMAGQYDADLSDHALARLGEGDALLILDGLDEVGDPRRREQVAQAIADLAQHRYPQAHLLVTCRVRQYPLDAGGCPMADWALPGFHVSTLSDFDGDQIVAFIAAWFHTLCDLDRFSEEVCEQQIASLKEAISLRPDLQEVAPRPLLLTQMALVHDLEGELPGTRVQLYDKCADLLLWKWELCRAKRAGQQLSAESWIREQMGVPSLRKEDLERALDHAVYDAHAGQGAADEGPIDVPEETLRQRLCECLKRADRRMPNHEAIGKAQFFIDEYLGYRNGLIVPAGERTFQTPHRTFQEFLAARWLQSQQRDFDRTASRLVQDNYGLWREVFLLAVGQAGLGDAVDAVDLLCPQQWPTEEAGWQYVILAGQGLDDIGLPKVRRDERGPDVEERVTCLLRRTMQDTGADGDPNDPSVVPIPTRYAAAETLDCLRWLPSDLDAFVQVPSPKSRPPIYVARYPVTNVQFERFIAADGYKERGMRWWSDQGWAWRVEKPGSYRGEDPVSQPEYWDHPRFGRNRRGYPVVGVSWYEVQAYCAWLTEEFQVSGFKFQVWRDGKLETLNLEPQTITVRLPTEQEWVTAAGGEEGGRRPWGQDWDEGRANTWEGGIDGTTPVAMYPSGQSTHGVWDMGGNVWEWMASPEEVKPLRGGSWNGYQEDARARARDWSNPGNSGNLRGFRVVASPAGSGF